jgi:hypothetical protein
MNDDMSTVTKTPIQEINELHRQIVDAAVTSFEKAIRIGELLTAQRENVAHGGWLPWLKSNVQFTDRTARNYMRVFENRDRLKLESVSDLPSAYRLLSDAGAQSPEVSDQTAQDFIDTALSDLIEAKRALRRELERNPTENRDERLEAIGSLRELATELMRSGRLDIDPFSLLSIQTLLQGMESNFQQTKTNERTVMPVNQN